MAIWRWMFKRIFFKGYSSTRTFKEYLFQLPPRRRFLENIYSRSPKTFFKGHQGEDHLHNILIGCFTKYTGQLKLEFLTNIFTTHTWIFNSTFWSPRHKNIFQGGTELCSVTQTLIFCLIYFILKISRCVFSKEYLEMNFSKNIFLAIFHRTF